MVGNGIKIQWRSKLHVEASWMLDGLTFGKTIGIVWRGDRAKRKGIERVISVHM